MAWWIAAAALGMQLYSHQQNEQALDFQSEVNTVVGQFNAEQLQEAAADIDVLIADRMQVSLEQADDTVSLAEQVRGKGRTAFAANNVLIASGSTLDWEMDIDSELQGDLDRIHGNLAREIRQLKDEQADLLTQARFELWEAEAGVQTNQYAHQANHINTLTNMLNVANNEWG